MKSLIPLALILMAMSVLVSPWIGHSLYRLQLEQLEWWNAFCVLFALAIGIRFLNAFQLGIYQVRNQFAEIAKLDILICWCLFLPIFIVGLHFESRWIVWGAYPISDLLLYLGLRAGIRKAML